MAIASITVWLASREKDYDHGRLLYEQYGKDTIVLAIIRSGRSQYHFNELYQALVQLNATLSPVTTRPAAPTVITPAVKKERVNYDQAPEEIWKIRDEKNQRYARARKLFESIPFMDSQCHRLDAGLEILSLMDQVSDAWKAIDTWNETGQVLEQQKHQDKMEIEKLSLKDLLRQEKNIQSNISKDRARLKESESPERIAKVAARIQSRKFQLTEIRRRIDELV